MQFLAIQLLIFCSISGYSQTTSRPDTSIIPKKLANGYTLHNDILYTKVNGWNGTMDVYLPPFSNKPAGMVIYIHGGGWVNATKRGINFFTEFFECGLAVATVEYRLASVEPAPAAIEDIRCALAYLKNNAGTLNIDTTKLVLMGTSAGGHLALMAGMLQNDQQFSKNCSEANNVKISAIIDESGITDIGPLLKGNTKRNWAIKWIGDKINDSIFILSVSPISYANKNNPPIFIIHSNSDPVVPYQQSVDLYDKLKNLGVKTELMTINEATHVDFSGEETKKINTAIITFLKQNGICLTNKTDLQ